MRHLRWVVGRWPRACSALAVIAFAFVQLDGAMAASRTQRPYRFALAACDGKAQGAACSFTDRAGAGIVGQCALVPDRVASDARATVVAPPPLLMCRKAP